MTEKEKLQKRRVKAFYFNHCAMCWDEIPLDARKLYYPEYFDKEDNDCYPIRQNQYELC